MSLIHDILLQLRPQRHAAFLFMQFGFAVYIFRTLMYLFQFDEVTKRKLNPKILSDPVAIEVAYGMAKSIRTYCITKTVVYGWGLYLSDKDYTLSLAAALLALEAFSFVELIYYANTRNSSSALATPPPLPPRILQSALLVVGVISLYFPDQACAILSIANFEGACLGI